MIGEKPSDTRPSRRYPARATTIASLVVPLVVFTWHLTRLKQWIVDDAAITFAYARNLSEGNGPVVQPGADPVEGYSNPLWTFFLALLRLFGLFDRGDWFGVPDYVIVVRITAVVFTGIVLMATLALSRRISPTWAPVGVLVTGIALAGNASYVGWVASGLENGMYAAIIATLAAVTGCAVADGRLRGRRVAAYAGLLAAAAALTRPDGLIYVLVYPVTLLFLHPSDLLVRSRWTVLIRPIAAFTASFALPFGVYLLWRRVTFDAWVPNTAVAKDQGVPDVDAILESGDVGNYLTWPGVIAVSSIIVAGIALAVIGRKPSVWLPVAVTFAATVVAFCVLTTDWMAYFRFATPIWTAGAMLLGVAIVELLSQRRAIRVVTLAAIIAAVALAAGPAVRQSANYVAKPTFSACLVVEREGRLYNGAADILGITEGSLLAPDLGGTAMTSRLRVYDLAGLVDERFARLVGKPDKRPLYDEIFEVRKPTFIHLGSPWGVGTRLTTDPRLDRDYVLIYRNPAQPMDGNWVRRDAVVDQAGLDRVRVYMAAAVKQSVEVYSLWGADPLAGCGTLRPGQVTPLKQPLVSTDATR